MAIIYLALGSNIGEREVFLARAIERLEASGKVHISKRSSLYETEPVGAGGQPWFLNMVVKARTELDPQALLMLTTSVEDALGRTRTTRWAPRTIDIDILLYDDLRVTRDDLVIPHPEMHRRRFVLIPLLEVDPEVRLPGGERLTEALAKLTDGEEVRKIS